MNKFKNIDEICKHLILGKLYNVDCKNDLLKEEQEVDKIINKRYIEECLKNIDETYNILYYSIIFKEEIVSNLIDNIIISLMNNMNENRYNPIYKILELAPVITDFSVVEMLGKIDIKNFNYNYHILKRKEISDYIKNELLENYSLEELEMEINNISCDIEQKLIERNIFLENDLNKYKDINEEIFVYKILVQYRLNLKILNKH
jgi:hypothetical protein